MWNLFGKFKICETSFVNPPLLQHFFSGVQRVSPVMRSVAIENFWSSFQILDGSDYDPGSVEAVDHRRIARVVHQAGAGVQGHGHPVLLVQLKS